MNKSWGDGKIKKQVILTILTLFFVVIACNAVSAAVPANGNHVSITKVSKTVQTSVASTAIKNISISGKVTRCTTGGPFSGVIVVAKNNGVTLASNVTNKNGKYILNFKSKYNIFNVTASSSGHTPSTVEVKLNSNTKKSTATANFMLGAGNIYVDDNWVNYASGTKVYFPGDPNPHVIGSDAFGNIANGITNTNANGILHIADGTYTGSNNRAQTISKNIAIVGSGVTTTIIDAQDSGRIFSITNGVSVSISKMTLRNGYVTGTYGNVNGGAIYNSGTLLIDNCTFTSNEASSGRNNDAFGGAIYSDGSLNVINSVFTSNKVSSSSGTSNDDGGAIAAYGDLSVTNSAFTSNSAGEDGGAIVIGNENTEGMNVAISSCTFTTNTAGYGGAIWNHGGTTVSPGIITGSTFTSNSAPYGGVLRNWGIMNINNSNFVSNTGTQGGVINNYDTEAVTNVVSSNFTSNTATQGGVLYNTYGTATLNFNSMIGNSGTDIYRYSGSVNAINNWWGSNLQGSSPLIAGRVNANVNVATWLVLNVNVSSNLIKTGGTSVITADLTHDQNGVYYNPTSGHVPDGIIASFTGTLGSLSPLTVALLNGVGSSTFTSGSKPGIATVTTTLNSQTANNQITIGRDDVYVSPTGDDTNGDGSSEHPFKTIGTAISGVYPGGTVHIASGTYTGTNNKDLTVNKNMNIVGSSASSTILNAENSGRIFNIVNGVTVTISNLTLENANAAGNGGAINNAGTLTINSCNLLNNVASGTGEAIYNTGTINIHFNRIIGTGIIIASQSGSANATNNWWGSNSSPSGKVSGNVNVSTWLVLNIKATPTTIQTGDTSKITVDLTHDQNGVYYSPSAGHVPDGIPVSFTSTLGSIDPSNVSLINGIGISIFTAGSKSGSANVNAQYDSQNVSTTITIGKYDVDLMMSNYPWYPGLLNYKYKQQIVFLMQVNNLGTTDATHIISKYIVGPGLKVVSFNAIQPGTLTFDSTTNTITWTIDYLGGESYAAASILLESVKTGNGDPNFELNAYIDSCDQNILYPEYASHIRYLTINQSADIQVNQSANNYNPQKGDYVTIIITTTNKGPNDTTNIKITDLLPNGLYLNSTIDPQTGYTTTSGTYDPTTGIWTIDTLNNGATATLTIIAKVIANPETKITNRAYLSDTPTIYDWNTENNSKEITLNSQNTDVDLMMSNYPWYPGLLNYKYKQQIVFLMQVNNLGTTDATHIISKYIVGPGLKVVSFNAIQPGTLTFDSTTNTITWTIDYLGGESYAAASILLESVKTGNGDPNFELNAYIDSCDQNILYPEYASHIRYLTINQSADIQVNQSANNYNPQKGDYVTIIITTTNKGPNDTTNIKITDLLPNGLYLNSTIDPQTGYTTTSGTYDPTTGIWTIDTLNNGATATLTIIAKVIANPETKITNRAYLSDTPTIYDWNTENNSKEINMEII
jgi:uncharacterized repeat protein (TIGR01451 family)